MKKLIITALSALTLTVSAEPFVYSSATGPDTVWTPYRQAGAQIGRTAENTLKFSCPVKNTGIQGKITVPDNRRYKITVDLRGTGGTVALAVSNDNRTGYYYSAFKLDPQEWRQMTASVYAYPKWKQLLIYIYAANEAPVDVEIREVRVEELPAPELLPGPLDYTELTAADFAGTGNGKTVVADGITAISGGNWYLLLRSPAPQIDMPFYAYVRCKLEGESGKLDLFGGHQPIKKLTLNQSSEWQWLKFGPLTALETGAEITLRPDCAGNTRILIEKLVFSTKSDLKL